MASEVTWLRSVTQGKGAVRESPFLLRNLLKRLKDRHKVSDRSQAADGGETGEQEVARRNRDRFRSGGAVGF